MKNGVKNGVKNGAFGFTVKVRGDGPKEVQSGRLVRIIGGDEEGQGGLGDLGRVTSVEFL